MRKDVVLENETLEELSKRLLVPGCMLLRANRIMSAAWLLPGREVDVPEPGFCEGDDFECPVEVLNRATGWEE